MLPDSDSRALSAVLTPASASTWPELAAFRRWLTRKYPLTSTPTHYASDLSLFFTWLNKPPLAVTVRDIDAFIQHCQSVGHRCTTLNRRLAALRAFFGWLELERALDRDAAVPNPVLPKRHFIRLGQRLPRDVQDADLETLFAALTTPRDRAMFMLMLRCGLRVGEVRRLSLPDLFLQPASPAPGGLPRVRVLGKGQHERIVYLSAQALTALQAWLAVRPPVADQAVFLNRFGQRLTVTGIQYLLSRACHAAGLWITCHQFRHSFGRHLAEARVPVTSIQQLLGHHRLKSTEVYLHLSDPCVQADYAAAMRHITQQLPLPDLLPQNLTQDGAA